MRDVEQTDLVDWDESRPWPIRLTDEQRLDWLRLIRSERIGPATFRSLFNHYGSARAALDALPDLAARRGAKRRIRICPEATARAEMEACARLGIALVAPGEADYPPAMRHMPSPPPLLAVLGQTKALRRTAIAIVGPRNASAVGIKFAGQIAAELSEAGLLVVSGLARGIDGAAHAASLQRGTVASLAGGLDRIYPPEHDDLARRITETGVLISEMPLGHSPRAQDFPRRNRLIAGMSLGTLVVQAAVRSGSLITARLANEMGREVFAVPGFPLDPRAEGTNRLIRNGATLTTSAADILDVLGPQLREDPMDAPAIEERAEPYAAPVSEHYPVEVGDDAATRLLRALGPEPADMDDILRTAELSLPELRVGLLELELSGRIERTGRRVALRDI